VLGAKRLSRLKTADQNVMAQRWLNGKLSVFSGAGAHRRQAEQIGFYCQCVVVGHIGVGRKRHRRIKPRAVVADAAMNRVEKILIAVIADPGFLVGGDVGRVQRAKRQFEREAAGIGLAVLRGVAGLAVCRPRQISAALDKARLRKRRRTPVGLAP
jgi:hypothetical protein